MAGAKNVNVDPKQLKDAKDFWHGFTKLMTYSILGVVVSLILMAIFLL